MTVRSPRCPNPTCRSELPAGQAVCPACGTSLTSDRDATRVVVSQSASTTHDRTTASTGAGTDDPDRTRPRWEADADPVPETLGRFRILAKIGEGAFGRVYRAHDPQLDREVALKVAKPAALDSPERVWRFVREARAAANLRHPNVVPVYDSGEAGGRHYIATGFIDGRTLQAEIKELAGRPAEPGRAAAVIRRLAEALGYAHSKGVVHRDVKPANVLADRSGEVLVADFGLATRVGDDEVQTQDGSELGTPAYMSPEQAAGRSREATAASDQYALGVVLYEMLAGRRPFDGSPQSVLLKHIHDDPPPPRALNPDVPRDLETVCLKCLAKDPAVRYPSCEALADDLRRWQAGEPVSARRLTPAERLARWVRRKPTQAALVLLIPLVFGLTAVAVALAVLKGQADTARDTADQLRGEAITARDGEKTQREQAEQARDREKLALQQLDGQDSIRKTDLAFHAFVKTDSPNALRALRLLAEVAPPRRNWEWRHIARSLAAEERRFQLNGPTAFALALRPDGRRVYVAAHEGVRAFDPQTGDEYPGYHGGGRATSVVLHPDGKRAVSSTSEGAVHVWEVATGKPVRVLKVAKHFLIPLALHPDGKTLAVGEADGRIGLWDPDSGERKRALRGHTEYLHQLAFAPNGRLYSGGMDGSVRAWDVAAGKEVAKAVNEHGPVWAVAPSPDGQQVWTADEYGFVTTWTADELKKVSEFPAHEKRVWRLTFSPDGRSFATGSMDQTAKVWKVGATAEPVVTLRGHVEDVCDVRFLPGGRQVVTCGDDTVRVWDLKRDGAGRKADAGGAVYKLDLGADGRWAAVTVVRQTPRGSALFARVFDAVTGEPLAGWADPPANTVSVSPDGKAVAHAGRDGKVVLCPIDPLGQPASWNAHPGGVTAIGYSPAGDRLASTGVDGKLRLSDAATGVAVWAVPFPGQAWDIRFHPDGKTVVTAGFDRTIRLFDSATGKLIRELTGHTHEVMRVAFSPDGRQMASGSKDNTVRVWDWATGEQVRQIRTHNHFIHGVAFSPHGRLADCGDSTLTLYDAATGQETITLHGHGDQVTGVGFSPDGARLVSGSMDGTIRIWEAPPTATVTLPAMGSASFDPGK